MSNRVPTTTNRRSTIINRFLSGESGVVFNGGRMATYQVDENTVALLSYTNEVIAEVSDDGSEVTLFTGHYGQVSKTTSEHIGTLGSILSNTEGKDVTVLEDAAPTMGIGSRATRSAQYINNYINDFTRRFSAVELDARETIEQALQERLQQLFN